MHGGKWKLSWSRVSVSQHRQFHYMWSSVYFLFFPYISCPLLHNSFGLWIDGFVESLNYYFGSREAGMWFMNSLSRDAFIALNTCCLLVGSVHDKGVASSSVRFFLLYIQCSFLIFLLFHLCWLLRETKRETVALLLRGFKLPSTDLPSPYTLSAFRPSK